jgi:hypothetical protein
LISALILHDRKKVGRQIGLERRLIILHSGQLAAFALGEDRRLATAGQQQIQVHPTTLKASGDMARFGRVAASVQHLVLQFGGESRPLLCKNIQQGAEVRIPVLASSFRGGTEALFGVLAALDQVIQGANDVFVLRAIRWPGSLHFPIVRFSQKPNRPRDAACKLREN